MLRSIVELAPGPFAGNCHIVVSLMGIAAELRFFKGFQNEPRLWPVMAWPWRSEHSGTETTGVCDAEAV